MTDELEITPAGPLRGTVRPPGSKSITNRALICAALADGNSVLEGALESQDTGVMIAALRQLGYAIQVRQDGRQLCVQGAAGRVPAQGADLNVANSGTTARFLASLVTLGRGVFTLDGTARMRQRPIGDLLEALGQLGTAAASLNHNGCPPVEIRAAGLPGGSATIRGDVSSQFLSGLLMAAPYARRTVELTVEGGLVSRPYVSMTMAVMAGFGVQVEYLPPDRFRIPAAIYRGRTYEIEPDASAASYFFAAAAITGGEVTVAGLHRDSLQGDVALVDVLVRMGCRAEWLEDRITLAGGPLRGVQLDMNPFSDMVQTLAAVALFADGPTTISGVAHIRHKETDRIGALATELRKLGATVDERSDGLRITPGPLHGAAIETYQDHRMAMSLSLVGLRVPGVVIRDPGCTAKTYPGFFQDLRALVP